ncbi:MAG: oxygen-independent coproporphyrinogen III oxidase [Candidatus Caenarcaniphilales bacterium]|nr:oxygen-independent coproporphyrinogen III oxidase [Candidatus Caenarcaniphilales bacterium]
MTDYIIELPNEKLTISSELLAKYDKMGPRYTSYPTAPIWSGDFKTKDWLEAIERSNQSQKDISLYFHIPFCRTACYYCACNFVVSPRSENSEPYMQALYREIEAVGQKVDKTRKVKQIHYGGGTPTFLNLEQLEMLFSKIKENFNVDFSDDSEISIEIDPRVTSFEQLTLLKKLGFNRVSLGVQDFNPQVQEAVNRIQSYEMVEALVNHCRELGYESINFDLIYGLPLQTVESFKETLDKVIKLSPDRIALFNYAHLPSLRPFQKAHIVESQLPLRDTKLLIFCEAMKEFSQNGYEYIGMDHFAKHQDELSVARQERTLHRNFQGYTTKAGLDLIGMGMTSIGSIDNTFTQNEKKLNKYLEFFNENYTAEKLVPIEKGYVCNQDDLLRRAVISKLLCHGVLLFGEIEKEFSVNFTHYFADELRQLPDLENDGLIKITDKKVEVTSLGRIFLRNIAMVFDIYLKSSKNVLFSRTV